MGTVTRSLSGALLAAAAMYWFDPASGRRRRARLRDRLASTARDARHIVDVGSRDLGHRLWGFLSVVRQTVGDPGEAEDWVIEERVRACLGRAVSHPGAIEVSAWRGRVSLTGDVLEEEHAELIDCVRSVRGVERIDDQLAVHAHARGVSALQGGRPRGPGRLDLLSENWSPAARLLIGTAGVSLALIGLRRRGLLGAFALTGGALAALRSLGNVPLRRLTGVQRRAIEIRKTVHIQAPVEQVFETLAHVEDYPLFMHHVRSVRGDSEGRSHWIVAGPAGVAIEWDSETTQLERDRLIAWRTLPGGPIRHAGTLRFESANGGTRLEIQMRYDPPAGVLGHGLATLFGVDPKNRLDDDMVRVKTYIETGKPPRDAWRRGGPRQAVPPTLNPATR
jgi:uncharacterized membrane protein